MPILPIYSPQKGQNNGGIKADDTTDGGINGGIKPDDTMDGGINGGIKFPRICPLHLWVTMFCLAK